jgi:hypothetical protein
VFTKSEQGEKMNIEQFTIAMIARTMWRAGWRYGKPWDQALAELSGHVLRNRVIHALGQVGWLEVLRDEESSFDQYRRDEITRAEDPAFLKILWLAERLYLQQEPDKVGDADEIVLGTPCARSGIQPVLTVQGSSGRSYCFFKGNYILNSRGVIE